MFEFEKLCADYEKMTYDERRVTLTFLAEQILPPVETLTGGLEAFEILTLASCSADGKLSVEEYSLFKGATGIDLSFDAAEELVRAVKGKDIREAADTVVDLFGELDEFVKANMVSFCLCLCAADGRVGLRERAFIRKLIQ